MHRKNVLLLGMMGILAALLVGIGEFLVHYSPAGYDSELAFGFFEHVNPLTMTIGHGFIIVGIPFYFVGYYHLYLVLKKGAPKLALSLFLLGALSFIIGGIWVSSRAWLGHLYHVIVPVHPELWPDVVNSYNLLLENLVNVLRVTIFMVSGLFVYIILMYKTAYPKWLAIFNPVLMLAIVFALFFLVPVIGNYLIPTAMNVAHLIVFSASVLALLKSDFA